MAERRGQGIFLSPDPYPTQIIEVPGLRCEVASAPMVLVLKARWLTGSVRTTTICGCWPGSPGYVRG